MKVWKKKLSRALHPLAVKLVSYLSALCLFIIYKCNRLTVTNENIILTQAREGKKIFALWHGHLFFLSCYYNFVIKEPKLSILISMSRDGDYAAEVAKYFKHNTVRGSTSKGARKAIRELSTCIKQGFNLILTPDGPRGPAFKVNSGILKLSQMTKAEIIPISYDASRKITLKSWDNFIIPLPFGKVHIAIGEPISIPRNCDQADIEQYKNQLEDSLNKLSDICTKALQSITSN